MNRLKELRKKNGIKQIEMSRLFNVSQGNISAWENNRWQPDNETLLKIAEHFNVSVDYLLGRTETKTPSSKDEGVDEDVLDVLNKLDQAGITAEKLSQLTDEQFIKLGAYLEGLLDSVQNK